MSQEKEVYSPDPNSWPYIFSPTFFTSLLLTLCFTLIISRKLAQKFIPEEYSKLGKKRSFCLTLLGSTVHALVVCILTSYLLVTGDLSRNLVFSKSPLGFAIAQISLGYFTGDFIFCLLDEYLRHDIPNLAHHIAGMGSTFWGLYHQGLFMYCGLFLLLFEFSTPFVNLFWVLMIVDRKSTREFGITSIAMVTVFFSCRLAPLYWMWNNLVLTLMDPGSEKAPLYCKVWLVGTFTALTVLNLMWFWKMVKGGLKEISRVRGRNRNSF